MYSIYHTWATGGPRATCGPHHGLMWPSGYYHDTDTSIDLQTRLTVIMNLKAKLVAKRVVLNIKNILYIYFPMSNVLSIWFLKLT